MVQPGASQHQFRYHKSGHQFSKTKYLRARGQVSWLTQIVIALLIAFSAASYYAVSNAAENNELRSEISSLKQQMAEANIY